MHVGGRKLDGRAVTGKQPLEAMRREALHGSGLDPPVVPAGVIEGDQPPRVEAPGQMISGEEYAIVEEQAGRASRVPGNGNRKEPGLWCG